MIKLLTTLFSSDGFMPHGHCYLWKPSMVLLQVVSNGLIGLSYAAISATLLYLVHRIRDIAFKWVYLAFGTFIITCSLTHFMEVWTVWNPLYWLDGTARAITAVASVATAVLLPFLVPKICMFAQTSRLALDRGIRVETAYQDLNKIFERTKELDDLKTRFFANVSHELRTPLTLILGPVEKIRAAPNLTEEQRRNLDLVIRNANTVLKHVNDLLDVAKLEAGKMVPNYIKTDLAKVVRLISSNFDGLAKERAISFSLDIPQSLEAQTDPDMIQRIILNLLSNAFKFVPSGGKIAASLREESGKAVISVQDNGPGIELEMRDAIFERFRQVDGGVTRRFGGTGLGLSIAKEFTELHGGRIQVEDSPGGGALFSVVLPLFAPPGISVSPAAANARVSEDLTRQAVEELKEVTRVAVGKPIMAQFAERGTVLVVEDNINMNHFIVEALSPEYQVISAFDGKEGLEKAALARPDLILSDIMMPEMSGDQMVSEIRKRSHLDGIPIVILTAKADEDLRLHLLRFGAQDYLIKPFSSEELLARVRNLVTVKRARETLQQELSSQHRDLESLAKEVITRGRELQQSAEKLRVAKNEAEQAYRIKSNFLDLVGLISHEMRTPITALQLQLEMLKRIDAEKLTPRQRTLLDRVWDSSQRSVILMDSLLGFTKYQSGRIDPQLEEFDLPSLVTELIDSLLELAQEKQLELKVHSTSKALPPIKSDRVLVHMVIKNLLANAIKYTNQGSIQIFTTFERGEYRVAVEDTGPGIALEQQGRIFEPFERIGSLREKREPGFGLGLAIAKETARILGGRIELSSEVGKGSIFVAIFPSTFSSVDSSADEKDM